MNRRGLVLYLYALTLLVASVAGVLAFLSFMNLGATPDWILPTSIGVTVATLSVAVGSLLVSRFSLVRSVPVRVALAGLPGVGKTVYANTAYQLLMDAKSPTLQLTPTTRTAQQVFQTIRGLSEGRWPASTTSDGIRLFRGKLVDKSFPLWSQLAFGRVEFDLEIADSAGEVWADFAKEYREAPDERPLLTQSTFFEYVAEASAILYFIDAKDLIRNPRRVHKAVDDLVSTVQLLSASGGKDSRTRRLSRPIAVVISKSDLLSPIQIDVLAYLFGSRNEFSPPDPDGELDTRFATSLRGLERLKSVLQRVVEWNGLFFVSSVGSLRDAGIPVSIDTESAVEHGVVEGLLPLEWSLVRAWRGYRSRGGT